MRKIEAIKRIIPALLLAAGLVTTVVLGPVLVSAASADEMIAEAQKLSDQEKFKEANEILFKVAKENPDHPDVYWKIAQNYYDIGERIDIEKDKDGKLLMYQEAEKWAKIGYEKNPELADNSFWMAVGMSQQAQTRGIVSTLMSDRTLAKRIEEFYIKASQAKEYHYRAENADTISSAHFALGMFYRKIPDSLVVRALMGTRGDMDKSVEHLRTAVSMYPKNIDYNKELGVSLLCRGQNEDEQKDVDEGMKYLKKATELPAKNSLDKIDQADAKRLMADPSLACGYSRVQQEEVSEDAFKE